MNEFIKTYVLPVYLVAACFLVGGGIASRRVCFLAKVASPTVGRMSEFHMRRYRTFDISFSWRRALGISGSLASFSRLTGLTTSQSGRQRRMGQIIFRALGLPRWF